MYLYLPRNVSCLCSIEGFLYRISFAMAEIHKTSGQKRQTPWRKIASSAVLHGKRELVLKFDLNSFARREIPRERDWWKLLNLLGRSNTNTAKTRSGAVTGGAEENSEYVIYEDTRHVTRPTRDVRAPPHKVCPRTRLTYQNKWAI